MIFKKKIITLQPEVMRKQSTEGMPFPIIFSGALCGLSWLMYGVVLNNDFIIVSFQLLKFIIYLFPNQ